MAATSLRHIKGRLKDLINYVENPEKTAAQEKDLQDFYNVFAYVSRPEATEQGEYVSAINCLKEIALSLSTRRAISTDCICTTAICSVFSQSILTTSRQAPISKRTCGS